MIKITRMMRFATGRPRGGDALTFNHRRSTPCSVPCAIGRRFSAHSDPPRSRLAPRGGPADARPVDACPWNNWRAAWSCRPSTSRPWPTAVAGSLRDAITQANAHAGADIIVFQPGLTGTIALTGGELDITDDLKINGPGADKLTVSGNNTSRVFKVEAGETVTISGLTIAGGNAGTGNGGGIDNFGTLTVSNIVFSGNAATDGGGLANQSGGTATVRDSTFTGNSADAGGGGHGDGGGLANESGGTVTVTGSTFTGNSAVGSGGGLVNFGRHLRQRGRRRRRRHRTGPVGTVTVRDSTFTGNSAGIRRRPRQHRDGDGERQHLHRQLRQPAAAGSTTSLRDGERPATVSGSGMATVSGSTFTGNSASSSAAASTTTLAGR